uniref:Chromatin modification-related protein EAF1 (ESA1-associated factor 1) (Vacuolar import and degradation protein 21) n=1 Tax=Ganoderma boninense TaxID=34458 RepID=A0A5K1K1W2_9APHY|nr:Chromatin modification-related protein EAF1 (ESA1-associated factor 1) (Vacuolar import and degradation protein 21) [Ganoderma boninense]
MTRSHLAVRPSYRTKQLVSIPLSLEKLLYERQVTLDASVDLNTSSSYSSACNMYLCFCQRLNLPFDPTPETLSLFVVHEALRHLELHSINTYLSGICNKLKPFYPRVRLARRSPLVRRTLKGTMRLYSQPTRRKRALAPDDLDIVAAELAHSTLHDDRLFFAQLLTGFHGLLRLGRMVWPDNPNLRSSRKLTLRTTIATSPSSISFLLHSHKSDCFFDGDRVLISTNLSGIAPINAFTAYLASRDNKFPFHPQLWLRGNRSVPTRRWFISRLHKFFPADISGHSMRSGGATTLAVAGVSSTSIQAIGRWSSDAWQVYIRKHPVLVHAQIVTERFAAPH